MSDDQPDQYKKGWVEFYKLRFKVTPDVLIPRPETELLVDEVLNFAKSKWQIANSQNLKTTTISHKPYAISILDIGTGAGPIAISIAKNLTNLVGSKLNNLQSTYEVNVPTHPGGVHITATEVSEKALEIAHKNAQLHGVEDKITFIVSDILSAFPQTVVARNKVTKQPSPQKQNFDIIVTNLPYIPSERINYLDPSVKDWEPHVALDGGHDGFDLYRKLFKEMVDKNIIPKMLVGEIDYTHAEIAINEANKFFPKAQAEVKLDLYHRQRILKILY
jgi:release factor glutamine methyltransferase